MQEKNQKKKREQQAKKWIGSKVCRNYTIEQYLDSGTFGFVFKANRSKPEDLLLNKPVKYAVKIEDAKLKSGETLT